MPSNEQVSQRGNSGWAIALHLLFPQIPLNQDQASAKEQAYAKQTNKNKTKTYENHNGLLEPLATVSGSRRSVCPLDIIQEV